MHTRSGITTFIDTLTKVVDNDLDIIVVTQPNTSTVKAPVSGRVQTTIYWGDSTTSSVDSTDTVITHTYDTPGEYTITIKGNGGGVENFETQDTSIASVLSYGRTTGVFPGVSTRGSLVLSNSIPTSSAVLSRNLDLRGTFENGNILENTSTWTNWDTRAVQNVSRCFANISSNSSTIVNTNWSLNSATTFVDMFSGAYQNSTQNQLNLPNLSITSNSVVSMCQGMNSNANITLDNLTFTETGNVNASFMFANSNLSISTANSLNTWNTANLTILDSAFQDANVSFITFDINNWNTSNITSAANAYYSYNRFGGDLSITGDWSKLINARGMFAGTQGNVDSPSISDITWTTSNSLINTREMFYRNARCNANVTGWVLGINSQSGGGGVVAGNCDSMVANSNFNHSTINTWDVSACSNLKGMFRDTGSFNQDLYNWNVSNVTNLAFTFANAYVFNANITPWNVSSVTTLANTFANASSFNQDISSWNVSGVTNLVSTFHGANSFAANVSGWDTSSVIDFSSAFENASAYNHNLGSWDISNAVNMRDMLDDSGLNIENYNKTLIGWADASAPSNVTLGADNIQYDSTVYTGLGATFDNAIDARNYLVYNKSFTIEDDELALTDPVLDNTAVSWTPDSIYTNLWLDATDSSNVTTISGKVRDWQSRGDVAGSLEQEFEPAFRPDFIGGSAPRIKGQTITVLYSNTSSTFFGLSNAWTVMAVVRPYNTIPGDPTSSTRAYSEFMRMGQPSSNSTDEFLVGVGPQGWGTQYKRTSYANAYVSYGTASPSVGKPTIAVWDHGPSSANVSTDTVFVDGSAVTTLNSSLNTSHVPVVSGTQLSFGGGPLETYEIVIVANASEFTRQKVEGYFAWRWTLQGNLPDDHPYKNSAPT